LLKVFTKENKNIEAKFKKSKNFIFSDAELSAIWHDIKYKVK
jgi:hypothetical protein